MTRHWSPCSLRSPSPPAAPPQVSLAGPAPQEQMLLHLPSQLLAECGTQGQVLPTTYELQPLPLGSDKMYGFMQQHEGGAPSTSGQRGAAAAGSKRGRVALEGTIEKRFDARPLATLDAAAAAAAAAGDVASSIGAGGGSVAIDPAYRAFTRQRTEASLTRTRQALTYEQDISASLHQLKQVRGGGSRLAALSVAKEKHGATKPPLSRDELEAELFTLFERSPHWTFAQLQKETGQAAQALKAALTDIATQHQRGPLKGLYEVRREYRTKAARDAALVSSGVAAAAGGGEANAEAEWQDVQNHQ